MLAKCQEKVREFRRKFKLVLENSHKVFVHAIQIELFWVLCCILIKQKWNIYDGTQIPSFGRDPFLIKVAVSFTNDGCTWNVIFSHLNIRKKGHPCQGNVREKSVTFDVPVLWQPWSDKDLNCKFIFTICGQNAKLCKPHGRLLHIIMREMHYINTKHHVFVKTEKR